jgi:hypothetical protein
VNRNLESTMSEGGHFMEYIGVCKDCNKEIFCLDGFLNGVLTEEKDMYCFDCSEKKDILEK